MPTARYNSVLLPSTTAAGTLPTTVYSVGGYSASSGYLSSVEALVKLSATDKSADEACGSPEAGSTEAGDGAMAFTEADG